MRIWMRRFIAAVFAVVLTAVSSGAFKLTIHTDITKEAFRDLYKGGWTPPRGVQEVLNGHWFSEKAIKEITDANESKDAGDCLSPANAPANPCRALSSDYDGVKFRLLASTLDSESLAVLFMIESANAADHFDAEAIHVGSNNLWDARKRMLDDLVQHNFVKARKELGGALHSIQDFYAHSNWVELSLQGRVQGKVLEERLGQDPKGQPSAFVNSGSPEVARSDDFTCVDGNRLLTDLSDADVVNLKKTLLPGDSAKVDQARAAPALTSGYFSAFKSGVQVGPLEFAAESPRVSQGWKCRHGFEMNTYMTEALRMDGLILAGPGLNKDEEDQPRDQPRYFKEARLRAYGHTMKFVLDLLAEPQIQRDPTIILGFMGHPTISRLTPSQTNSGNGDFLLAVSGSGFSASTTVFWNGRRRDTVFVDDKLVRASISKSDVAQAGTAQVDVHSPEQEPAGVIVLPVALRLASLVLDSNVVPFTIAAPPPPPPTPPTPPTPTGGLLRDCNQHRYDPATFVLLVERFAEQTAQWVKTDPEAKRIVQEGTGQEFTNRIYAARLLERVPDCTEAVVHVLGGNQVPVAGGTAAPRASGFTVVIKAMARLHCEAMNASQRIRLGQGQFAIRFEPPGPTNKWILGSCASNPIVDILGLTQPNTAYIFFPLSP